MKIVLNRCYGGFDLSEECINALSQYYDAESIAEASYDYDLRTEPHFIEIVETLGDKANGGNSKLKIIEFSDEATDWLVHEYDGFEEIHYVVDGLIYMK